MKQKLKALAGKLKKSKLGKSMSVTAALAVAMSITMVAACAVEGDTTGVTVDMAPIMSAFTTGIQGVITMSIQLLTIMLPAVLSFFAVKFICIKGMAWFKQMNK